MKSTGERFKQIRKEFAMSQEEFGEHLGLSKAGVSAVEKDRTFVSAKVLSKLFFDYNINLNYLVCGVGSLFNPPKYENIRAEILCEVEKMLKEKGL